MKKAEKSNHGPEIICTAFTFIMYTLYLIAIPPGGYVIISEWKYHIFLLLYIGFIALMAEQKLVNCQKSVKKGAFFQPFSLAILAYFFFTCISGVASKYPGVLLGNDRHDGVLTIGLYVISTLLLAKYLRTQKVLLFAFGSAITLYCLLGITQLMGANPFYLYPVDLNFYDAGNYYMGQYWGTSGNTNICAALLSTSAGTFAAASVRASRKEDWLYLIPLNLSVFCIIELNSEAGIVALMAGLLLMPPFIVFDENDVKNLLLTYGTIFLTATGASLLSFYDGGVSFVWNILTSILCFGMGLFSIFWVLLRKVEKLQHLSIILLRKLLITIPLIAISLAFLFLYLCDSLPDGFLLQAHELLHGNWDDSYGSNRIYIWRQAWSLVRKAPLLGGGPDTLGLRGLPEFSRYNETTGTVVTSSIDAAHNEYLNILVNQGALALGAYLTAIGISMFRWWKNSNNPAPAVAGTAALFYLIQAFFGISMCITAPYLWIALAIINIKTERTEKDETSTKTHRTKPSNSSSALHAASHRYGR